jgi:hypothetical protein
MCNLKHCRSIGEVPSSEVSVSHSNSSAIGKVPVGWCMRGIAGSAVNVDSSICVIIGWRKCYFIETIAIVSKLYDQRIKTYRNNSLIEIYTLVRNMPLTVKNFSLIPRLYTAFSMLHAEK